MAKAHGRKSLELLRYSLRFAHEGRLKTARAIPFRDSCDGAWIARLLALRRAHSAKARLVPRLSRLFERYRKQSAKFNRGILFSGPILLRSGTNGAACAKSA